MAGKIVYECCICKAQRNEVNHWFVAFDKGHKLEIVKDFSAAKKKDALVFCGVTHLQQWISQKL